jgi:DNA topoisomerase-2
MNHAVDESICKSYQQLKESESVKSTSMWVGSHEVETHSVHTIKDNKFVLEDLIYPFSIVQVGVENIANMLDRKNECKEVDTFRISFDEKTGEMTMFNNGPSIPVAITRDSNNEKIWLPEMLCTKFLSGSNHDKTSQHKRISLGVHGIGLKATASMSVKMKIECVDTERGLYYKQIVENGNTKVNEPDVTKIGTLTPKELKKGGTRFTFLMDYDHYKNLPDDIFKTLNKVFKAKAYQISAYSGIKVFYNDIIVPIKNAKQLACMYFDDKHAFFELGHPEWGLSVAIGPPCSNGKGERISIINGGVIESGVHFEWILDCIASDARSKVEHMLKDKVKWRKTLVTGNLSILIVGSLPDLIFDAQIKNNLKMKNHKDYMSQYTWPKTYINKVWDIVKAELGIQYIVNSNALKTKKRRTIQMLDKYMPAYKLKTPESDLLAFEGDSAKSAAKTAMADSSTSFSRKTKGIFLLGGCPINAMKHISTKTFGNTDHNEPDTLLSNNVTWMDFMTAMGLEYEKKYTTEAEFNTLNYRRYTNVVDKDPHGMGKIGPIMIANIHYFWPELLQVPGFLGYMDTPLIRAYPTDKKKKVKEFASLDDFEVWGAQFPFGKVVGYRVKWYKGLATHTDRECIRMFGRYEELRISYTDHEKRAAITLAGYFGRDTDARKELLILPPVPIQQELGRTEVELADCLDYFTREEQQYNIACKINHMIDNGILSHRRILWGIIDYIRCRGNKEIKVYQLGAYIAEKFGYHHGDTSLYGAMIWLTQDYVGARNIPLGLPISQFGTRFEDDDAGAPRYIDIQGNPIVLLLYPPEDMELLDMSIEDGKPTIPKHLVPVLPMHIMETNHLPGTGWAIRKLARHYKDVVVNIKNLLDGKMMMKMRPWTPNWNGTITTINGAEWSFGACKYDSKTRDVTITELPYQTNNNSYINGDLKRKKLYESRGKLWSDKCLLNRDLIEHKTIEDKSTKMQICITFKLAPGAIDIINADYGSDTLTPLQDYLYLKSYFGALLNFVDDDGCINTFSSYEGAMIPWFLERWNMYPKRFERQRIIIRLQIQLINNKLRYINEHKKLNLPEKDDDEQDVILADARFIKFNTARLKSPKVQNDKIQNVVLNEDASYNYLLMNHRQMGKKAIDKMKKEIIDCEHELERLCSTTIVRDTWISEINVVVNEIEKAHANGGWVFEGDHNF